MGGNVAQGGVAAVTGFTPRPTGEPSDLRAHPAKPWGLSGPSNPPNVAPDKNHSS
jgi:hypothetical protein